MTLAIHHLTKPEHATHKSVRYRNTKLSKIIWHHSNSLTKALLKAHCLHATTLTTWDGNRNSNVSFFEGLCLSFFLTAFTLVYQGAAVSLGGSLLKVPSSYSSAALQTTPNEWINLVDRQPRQRHETRTEARKESVSIVTVRVLRYN